jgi:serine/threonine protein kinase
MPPPLPDRYALEVRLGRDRDIEAWLATDTSLDRPVEIRVLGPDADDERRHRFLESVRGAAAVLHPHLASVYTAGEVPDGVYAISEWTGAISMEDRLHSGDTIPVAEFLPNAAGLADALAALHAEGIVHGAIDTGCLFHSVSHPAKLGGIGRAPVHYTASEDVRDLARALEEILTGRPPGAAPPSEVVDGLNPAIDRIMRAAQAGGMTARTLADELAAAPSPRPSLPESPLFSRRLLLAAATLVLAATGLIVSGRLLLADAGSPILVPASPTPAQTPVVPTATVPPVTTPDQSIPDARPVGVADVVSVDPFGGDEENDERLANLLDEDPDTVWRTERYRDPLPALKPGVGVAFRVEATPKLVHVAGVTDGVSYRLAWSADVDRDPETWEVVTTGTTTGRATSLQLPAREPGWWLLWLVDLPEGDDGEHVAEIAEVRFLG